MSDKIVYLYITSWEGVSLGAEHYYGEYQCCGVYKPVIKEMTAKEAERLGKKDGWEYYKEGSTTERFVTKQEIIDQAIDEYKKLFPKAQALVLGRNAVADPQLVLDGDPVFMLDVNEWYFMAESIGWYEGGQEEKMEKIFKEFDRYMREWEARA